MRVSVIVAAAACSSGVQPSPGNGRASLPAHDTAHEDARPAEARPADEPVLADALVLADADAVTPAFDFIGDGVPVGFAGVTLGDPMPAESAMRSGTFEGAAASVWVSSDDGVTVSQISIGIAGDVVPRLAKRFGRAARGTWKGRSSWVVDAPAPFDFSGSVSTQLVIVPPDERHVCGRKDGFAPFYAALRRNVRAKNWAAVARSMTFPQTDWADAEGAEENVDLAGPADLIADPAAVFQFPLRGGTMMCDAATRSYTVVFGPGRLSPAIYATRGLRGAWRIYNIGHAPHDLF